MAISETTSWNEVQILQISWKSRKGYPLRGLDIPKFGQISVKKISIGVLYPYRCTDGGEIWHGGVVETGLWVWVTYIPALCAARNATGKNRGTLGWFESHKVIGNPMKVSDPIGIHPDFRYHETKIPIAIVRRWLRHDKFNLFHWTPTSDGQTDEHTAIAYTALVQHRAAKCNKKASIRWQDSVRRQFPAGLRGDVGL